MLAVSNNRALKPTLMTSMENSFTPKMRVKSDSELQEIIDNKEKFQESALLAAIWELERREKAGNEHIEIKELIETKKKQVEDKPNSFEIPVDIAKSIKTAAYILFGTIFLGLLNSVLFDRYSDVEVFVNSRSVSVLILTLVFMAFMAYMILLGRNWARVTFLVLFLLGFLLNIPNVIYYFMNVPVVGFISLIQTGLQVYALILLYNKESKEWYLKQKAKLTTK